MGPVLATIVEAKALEETVAAAFVAGVGVTLVFSVAIFGVARFGEMGREGRNAAAVAYGVLGALAALAFVATIVVGIIVMTQK